MIGRLVIVCCLVMIMVAKAEAIEVGFEPEVGIIGWKSIMIVNGVPENVKSVLVVMENYRWWLTVDKGSAAMEFIVPEELKPGLYVFNVFVKVEDVLPKNLAKKMKKKYGIEYQLIGYGVYKIMPYRTMVVGMEDCIEVSAGEIMDILKNKLGYLPTVVWKTDSYLACDVSKYVNYSVNSVGILVRKSVYLWPYDCDDYSSFALTNARRVFPKLSFMQVYGAPEWTKMPHAFCLLIDNKKDLYIFDATPFLGGRVVKYEGQELGISQVFVY